VDDISVLIGGKAGFGIDTASLIIARILNQLGLRIYIYRDYPSLIRGGHTFSIIRAAPEKVFTHRENIDFLLALNQDAFNFHRGKLKDNAVIIYDSDALKIEGLAPGQKTVELPLAKITQEEKAPEITRNTCIIGSFARAAGISWETAEQVLRKNIGKEIDLNLKIARRGFDDAKELRKIDAQKQKPLSIITGNDAVSLGLIKAGLKTYIAYPMTPSSSILHFLASKAEEFNLKVLHPESEISVMLMALGSAFMGEKTAVGTSGGGFCLMTEGLSLAGMSELPVVIFMGQRPGPSTGLPTYSSQADLHFVLNAGQGEFTRLVLAPGDPEEAYYLSAFALNLAWRFQVPAIILSDKNLGEGNFSFDLDSLPKIEEEGPLIWDRKTPYQRYLNTKTGISPLAFVPDKDAVIKINSYEHDESGITTEDAQMTKIMQEKRLRKGRYLLEEIEKHETIKVYGNKNASTALICWGSNKGSCIEVALGLDLKVIQPQVLAPFPLEQFRKAVGGSTKLICVESNATGQFARLLNQHGFKIDAQILKYDGRPFSFEELQAEAEKVL